MKKCSKCKNHLSISDFYKDKQKEDNLTSRCKKCVKQFDYRYKKKTNTGWVRHRMSHTKIYRTWASMKERCNNPNYQYYHRYGGRGIIVCDQWNVFENFYKDMGDKPEGLQLDRIDNDGNYCKENCKWSTPKENSNNASFNNVLEFNGKKQSVSRWAEELRINRNTLFARIFNGWSVEKTLTTPTLDSLQNLIQFRNKITP